MKTTLPIRTVSGDNAHGCSICGRKVIAKGLCGGHYKRAQLGKELEAPIVRRWTPEDIETVRRHYECAFVDTKKLASKLGRSVDAVQLIAGRSGFIADPSRHKQKKPQLTMNYEPPLSSEELAGRASARMKAYFLEKGHPRGFLGRSHTTEARSVISTKSRAAWANPDSGLNSDSQAQRRSDQMQSRIRSGKMRVGYSRSAAGRRADLDNRYFRSAWEANYARYLNWLIRQGDVAAWEFEPHTFYFEAIKRGTRSYLPDFKVVKPDGSHEWHEVKGWMDAKSKTKLARMARYYPSEKVVLIGESFFRTATRSGLAAMVGNWEGKR